MQKCLIDCCACSDGSDLPGGQSSQFLAGIVHRNVTAFAAMQPLFGNTESFLRAIGLEYLIVNGNGMCPGV
jgi:hypothetical protein